MYKYQSIIIGVHFSSRVNIFFSKLHQIVFKKLQIGLLHSNNNFKPQFYSQILLLILIILNDKNAKIDEAANRFSYVNKSDISFSFRLTAILRLCFLPFLSKITPLDNLI